MEIAMRKLGLSVLKRDGDARGWFFVWLWGEIAKCIGSIDT